MGREMKAMGLNGRELLDYRDGGDRTRDMKATGLEVWVQRDDRDGGDSTGR